jgi:hypothetical protein
MMTRGAGWVSGLERTRDLVAASDAHLRGARELIGGIAPEGGLTRELWNQDQASEESCAPRYGCSAIYGLTGVKCAPYVPWWAARVADGGEPVANVGVSVQAFVRSLSEHGAALEGEWDSSVPGFDPNARPSALARLAAQRRNLDIVPIFASGQDAVTAMAAALAQGLPGGLVVGLDDGYTRPATTGVVGPESGSTDRKHMVALWRYRVVAGRIQFLSPGTWGPSFGVHGAVWLDEDRVARSDFACFARSVS